MRRAAESLDEREGSFVLNNPIVGPHASKEWATALSVPEKCLTVESNVHREPIPQSTVSLLTPLHPSKVKRVMAMVELRTSTTPAAPPEAPVGDALLPSEMARRSVVLAVGFSRQIPVT
jgi:hypothetical protein